MGDRCKVQNHALIYEPAVLEDGVFVGPAVVFTNDTFPRAVTPDGRLKTADDWHAVGVTVRTGASIGARAVCIAPVVIGRWATVAAGAVVVKDVADFALVAGVPARRIGWVGPAGFPLQRTGRGRLRLPGNGRHRSSRRTGHSGRVSEGCSTGIPHPGRKVNTPAAPIDSGLIVRSSHLGAQHPWRVAGTSMVAC